jgi:hypothetical protein
MKPPSLREPAEALTMAPAAQVPFGQKMEEEPQLASSESA